MKGYKTVWFVIFLYALCFSSYAVENRKPVICNQLYALCTSAPCIPDPVNENNAICECVTLKGKSVGFKSCEERKPREDTYSVQHVISTFSFSQYSSKKSMHCPQGNPWTDCLDQPCTVDPQNAKRAICSCSIQAQQPFITFGGNCDTNTCATGFWSGALESTATILQKSLSETLTDKKEGIPVLCTTGS